MMVCWAEIPPKKFKKWRKKTDIAQPNGKQNHRVVPVKDNITAVLYVALNEKSLSQVTANIMTKFNKCRS